MLLLAIMLPVGSLVLSFFLLVLNECHDFVMLLVHTFMRESYTSITAARVKCDLFTSVTKLNIFSNKLFVILTSGTTGYKKSAGTGALHLTGGYRSDGSANIVRT